MKLMKQLAAAVGVAAEMGIPDDVIRDGSWRPGDDAVERAR